MGKYAFFVMLFTVCIISGTSWKLNVPRVLLPVFSSLATNFTLEVSENGCYRWSLSRLDVVQLIPVDREKGLECAEKVVLSTITKEFVRNTAIVLVENVDTGEVLRCDIIVDVISSLEVITTTRQLYIEEAPEVFEVCAYDDQSNRFTTLEGVEFNWSISSYSQTDYSVSNEVLRFMTFKESQYEIPSSVRDLDSRGLKGHMVLIEGVRTGSAKVSVSLKQPEYNRVQPQEVQLSVIANLIIEPADAYVLPGDVVSYKLLQVRSGKLVDISFPSQYYLKLEDSDVASAIKPWLISAERIGRTKVLLVDKHAELIDEKMSYLPSTTLTVDMPAYLSLSTIPYGSWSVIEHEPNAVTADVYNSKNHKFYIGQNVDVRITIAEGYFDVKEVTRNGSYIYGYPTKQGVAHISATFSKYSLYAEADMNIYPKVSVKPRVVYIPYDSNMLSKISVHLEAEGGDGDYRWSSSNTSVAQVLQEGLVKPQSLGFCEISASMLENKMNKGTADVFVLSPTHIDIIEMLLEGEVNAVIHMNVALYTTVREDGKLRQVPFTNCDNFPFEIDISNSGFRYNTSLHLASTAGDACTVIGIIGDTMGTTKVKISYKLEDRILEDSVIVSVHDPLRVLEPASGETVLAIGSQRYIVYSGGPATYGRDNRRIMSCTNEDVILIKEIAQSPLAIYFVTCISLGESILKIAYPMSTTQESAEVKIVCAKPKYIQLSANFLESKQACPLNINTLRASVLNYDDIFVKITVKDENDRVFDNATSLAVKWTLNPGNMGKVLHPEKILLREDTQERYTIPRHHYQLITPNKISGSLEVTALVSGYQKHWLKELDIEEPGTKFLEKFGSKTTLSISSTLYLTLVEDVKVTPAQLSIFNHPEYKAVLHISQGSGYYKVSSESNDIAEVVYIEWSHTIEVIPKSSGHVHITVEDACLGSKNFESTVFISTVGKIEAKMRDKVEKSRTIKAELIFYDSFENRLTSVDPGLLDLQAEPASDIISSKLDLMGSNIGFEITGHEIGETKIVFSAKIRDTVVRSDPVMVQVYPPLKLHPENVTLIPGAIFQLSATGGPLPNCVTEFSAPGDDVIKISTSGVMEGLSVGQVVVNGAVIGTDRDGKKLAYSEANAVVNVVYLDGIKIKVPLLRLSIGSKMPVWVEGVPDQLTPLVLCSLNPKLSFKWKTSSPDIASVRSIFHHTGIQVSDEDKVSMRITALKAGFVTISVEVAVPAKVARHSYTVFRDEINLEVFEELSLVKPLDPSGRVAGSLILSPDVATQLKTNKDTLSHLTYEVKEYSRLDERSSKPVITVSRDGFITTYGEYGSSLLAVTSKDDNGFHQSIQMNIEVKQVQYLMLNLKTELYTNSQTPVSTLPRGMRLIFHVSYHDDRGKEFAEVKKDIKLQSNRLDQVTSHVNIEDSDVSVDLLETGHTILKVWDAHSRLQPQDYIPLSVSSHIYPSQAKLTVGDVVCFSTPFVKQTSDNQLWSSSDEDALSIDPKFGIAVAKLKQSNVVISHQTDLGTTSTVVDIHPLRKIKLSPSSNDMVVSNNEKEYTIPMLLLADKEDTTKDSNMLSNVDCAKYNYTVSTFPFQCEIKFGTGTNLPNILDVFTVRPSFSFDTGLYSCILVSIPYKGNEPMKGNILLRVLWGYYSSQSVLLNFVSAVRVKPEKLTLTCNSPEDKLVIEGFPNVLKQIKVEPSDDVIYVKHAATEDSSVKYTVTLKRIKPDQMKIQKTMFVSVISALTDQIIQVEVVVKPFTSAGLPCGLEQWSFVSTLYSLIGPLIFVTAVVIISIVAAKLRNSRKGDVINTSDSVFLSPSKSHASTPFAMRPSQGTLYSFRNSSFEEVQPIYGSSAVRRSARIRT